MINSSTNQLLPGTGSDCGEPTPSRRFSGGAGRLSVRFDLRTNVPLPLLLTTYRHLPQPQQIAVLSSPPPGTPPPGLLDDFSGTASLPPKPQSKGDYLGVEI